MDIDERAEELYEQWVNGNRGYVASDLTLSHGAITGVALAVKLSALMTEHERAVLVRILKDKL